MDLVDFLTLPLIQKSIKHKVHGTLKVMIISGIMGKVKAAVGKG